MKNIYNKIKRLADNNRSFIQNLSYLSILQFFNLLLPLITYPYLIRVLGKETYGLVVYAQAIIGYLVIIVAYGFNISATKQVSIYRKNKEKLNEIVSSVIIIKGFLFLLTSIILVVLILVIPQVKGYEILFLLMLWICLYEVIFPLWYFQGIEKMQFITYINLGSRIIFLGLMFIFIQTPEDYLYTPIITGIGALLGGLYSLFVVFIKHQIIFILPSFKQIKYYLKDATPIFISNVSIKIYVSTNKVLVGTFLGMSEVAYYDLAEKLVNIMKMPTSIMGQALFPKVSLEKNIHFVRKIFRLSVGLNIIIYFTFILLSKYIVFVLGGKAMYDAILIVNLLAFTIPVVAMSNVFGIQLLIPFGHNKTFSAIIITSGIIYVLQAVLIHILWGFTLINIAIITITTEIFVTATMFYFCKKFKLWI